MPTFVHDGLAQLFHDRPDLAPTLVRELLGVELPRYTDLALETADLKDIKPASRYADGVVVLRDEGVPVHALVLEVQLAIDADKLLSWPAYVTSLRSLHRCDVELLVVTPDRAVARWAAMPIRLGASNAFRALVLGPEQLPCITDLDRARASPELAVLSAMSHARDEEELAVASALAATVAVSGLRSERALIYTDLVLAGLSDAVRRMVEGLMESKRYEYQSDFARRYFGAGKAEGMAEGRAEGKAEGKAELLVKQLRLRFGGLSTEARERVAAATNEELDRWAERILTAESLDDVLR